MCSASSGSRPPNTTFVRHDVTALNTNSPASCSCASDWCKSAHGVDAEFPPLEDHLGDVLGQEAMALVKVDVEWQRSLGPALARQEDLGEHHDADDLRLVFGEPAGVEREIDDDELAPSMTSRQSSARWLSPKIARTRSGSRNSINRRCAEPTRSSRWAKRSASSSRQNCAHHRVANFGRRASAQAARVGEVEQIRRLRERQPQLAERDKTCA